MRIEVRWALAALLLLGCDDDSAATAPNRCDAETNGWQYCVDDAIQYCHVGGDQADGHFHPGRNCAVDGLVCRVSDEQLGYCAEPAATCSAGEPGRCVDGDATNCVGGLWGSRRCVVGTECRVEDGWATCVQR
ncbi:MAG: hypothetical protein KC613_09935 [Myxococcales bacterium]|nr:hypothetical protein [Myxococcales bacterium]MCB9525637.1 hypothetical protein [Myxococcales bacterium]